MHQVDAGVGPELGLARVPELLGLVQHLAPWSRTRTCRSRTSAPTVEMHRPAPARRLLPVRDHSVAVKGQRSNGSARAQRRVLSLRVSPPVRPRTDSVLTPVARPPVHRKVEIMTTQHRGPVVQAPKHRRAYSASRPDAVGLVGVLFMAVATAAPITAMVGNVPIAVGFGNGSHAPAGYIVATIVLSLFAVGYVRDGQAHHRHRRLLRLHLPRARPGRRAWPAGLLTTMAYVVFEGSLIGIFAFFASDFFDDARSAWTSTGLVLAAARCWRSTRSSTYYDINIAAKVLGVFLVTEIVMLSLMALVGAVHGGGPEGWSPVDQPDQRVQPCRARAGTSRPRHRGRRRRGIGLFFAFWSWVGFESTAMYGEESREPEEDHPAGDHDRRRRHRRVLHVRVVDGHRRHRPAAGHRRWRRTRHAGEMFFGPVEQQPRRTGPSTCSSSC